LGDVPDPGQGQHKHGGQAGQVDASGGNKGLEKAFADPGSAGLRFPEAEGSGVCGRVFLARMPQVFPIA